MAANCVKNTVSQFQMVSQTPYDQLCWAAVALSVDRLRNPASTLQLCDVVQKSPPSPPGCCTDLSASPCNHIRPLLPALQALGRAVFGLLSENPPTVTDPGSMDAKWKEIKSEIDNGKVICAGVNWRGGGKHYVAIWGYEECDDGSRTVYVQDPRNGSSTALFGDFVNNYLNAGGRCSEMNRIA